MVQGMRSPIQMAVALASIALLGGVACQSNEETPRATRSRATSSPGGQAGVAALAAEAKYRPEIDPADFVDEIDNPLFTLEPGTVFKLRGETEDGIENETIAVTDRTRSVMGVSTTVLKDVVRVNGEIVESTFDWYGQDKEGNVWYFGENTAEYENGKIINRHGSWEAGVDGALPGIIMNADPQVTDSYRQEYYKGEAEDMYWVVATDASIKVPYGRFDNAVQVLEWNPLEPKVVVEKFYAPGVGLVGEHALSGGKENVDLLDVTHR
jgi:hypothetical protein